MRTKLAAIVVAGMMLVTSDGYCAPPEFATPDLAKIVRAARSLQDGFEKDAFDNFMQAAKWGNTEARKNVGLMYIKGIGVEKDWSKAYAWLRLAASEGDERIQAARDEVWQVLRDDEKEIAGRYYQELMPEYGDLAALDKRQEWARKQKREITGSRTGRVGALRIQAPDATGYQWELSGVEYFEVLDSYVLEMEQRVGTVELGEFDVIENDG